MKPVELAVFCGIAVLAVAAGLVIARLELINRDLHRAETSTVVWGTRRHLNQLRRTISDVIDNINEDVCQ